MTLTNTIRNANALSGLLLVLFLMAHLGGLISALGASASFEAYASGLHHTPWLKPLELGLALTSLLHISLSLQKAFRNRQAGNTADLISRRGEPLAAWASRNKTIAGVITLGFIGLHLQQLRFPRPVDGHEREALVHVLQQPFSLVVYCLGALAIGLHLVHGAEAAHRSLGWLDPANKSSIRFGGRMLAALVSGGFLLISLGLALDVGA
ncbi:succinate dehydrogenase cytochrome b subunit [Synechococcus sp. AH-558-M21]|nr:succinate dehydrogenase cytochrome b subunit [Synechococcus sp. AH-558-M21]